MEFLGQDIQRFLDWQEANGLLVMNNGNTYAGAGSYGFTNELQQTGDKVVTQNLWVNMNSQESSTISPQMYGELVFPYYKELASRFGLVYYGCCEPVDAIWEPYLSTLPNLRKVSCSAWCNEAVSYTHLVLYNTLRTLQFDEAELKRRDQLIDFFQHNKDEREKLSCVF